MWSMQKLISTYSKLATFLVVAFCCFKAVGQEPTSVEQIKYEPVDKELFDIILSMDKEYFDAYNSCDMDKQASLYSEDLEFFHDKAGLSTSKQDILKSIEENICGKVTRTLVEGSVEVYPIKDYGAVQIGYHKFYNNREPNAISKPVKFIVVWKNEQGKWKISKVISLH